ncbi:divalent cation tolerance protein CutA [candidate division GN15 bacterium]|nr:divalent cation tolerance protein CutA [candidate division GN15 bacterium]
METVRVVFISIPREDAAAFARQIVEERLAACANIVPKIESYYWWDGEINHDSESMLIIKTTHEKFADLQAFILANHPYDVPELIGFPLKDALPEYVAWVKNEVGE